MIHSISRIRRSVPAALVGISLAASLTVAGVAGAATQTSTPAGGSFGPGASGSVAAISGTSMEVQSEETGQVTVSWTSSTTFSQDATESASAVTAGDCVTMTGSSSKATITATTVSITQPSSSGSCTATGFGGGTGFGGRTGGSFTGHRPSGTSSGGFTPPSGSSGSRPKGFPGAGSTDFASGKVTSVSGNKLVVSGFSSASLRATGKKTTKKKSAKKPTIKATTVSVNVSSSTTYSETESAAATDLAVGDCVTATGSSSSTGAVTASTIHITSTGGKTCTTGFGGFGGSGGGAAGGGSSTSD